MDLKMKIFLRKTEGNLSKIYKYEFWPFWLFFFPLTFYWAYLAMRSKSLTYFTASNPGIDMGGLFGEEKDAILKMIPEKYLPKHLLILKSTKSEEILSLIYDKKLEFPLIAKPNVGERGNNVEKLLNVSQLLDYLENTGEDFIIQEFIESSIELGVFYYKYPSDGKTGISSIVKKEFLHVIGNGKESLLELISKNARALFQMKYLSKKFSDSLEIIIAADEIILLEPIGNHCRGTKFLNANDLINPSLVAVFDEITKDMKGFHFGRFDLKVSSFEDMYKGVGIKIMEVNGVSSEPGHIYDPSYNLLKAYKDVAWHMKTAFEISRENNRLGVEFVPAKAVVQRLKNHFFSK